MTTSSLISSSKRDPRGSVTQSLSVHVIYATHIDQGWRVLDGTRFLPRYLPVNTVLGKTGFGHPKWEKPGKTQIRSFLSNLVH